MLDLSLVNTRLLISPRFAAGDFSCSNLGERDACVVLFNASDGAEWARKQMGGAAVDEAFAIAAEKTVGDFFVTGTTSHSNAFGAATVGLADVFVLRLSADTLEDSLGAQGASTTGSKRKHDRLARDTLILIAAVATLLVMCVLLGIGYYCGRVRTELKYEQFRQREDNFDDSAAPSRGGAGRIAEPTKSLSQVLPAATSLELLTRPPTSLTVPTQPNELADGDDGIRGPKPALEHDPGRRLR